VKGGNIALFVISFVDLLQECSTRWKRRNLESV